MWPMWSASWILERGSGYTGRGRRWSGESKAKPQPPPEWSCSDRFRVSNGCLLAGLCAGTSSFLLCFLASAERGALAWESRSVSSNYSLWPLDISHEPPVPQCHHQQNVLNHPAYFTATTAGSFQWEKLLRKLQHDANMRHGYKLDPVLLIRSIAIYWIHSSFQLFDWIKGNIL